MPFLSTIIANKNSRPFVIGILIFILVIIAAHFAYKHIYEKGYNAGVAYQTEVYIKQQEKAKALLAEQQKAADKERAELNNQIANLSNKADDLQKALDDKNSKTQNKVRDYEKSTSGNLSCFAPDDDGMRIINESFPSGG